MLHASLHRRDHDTDVCPTPHPCTALCISPRAKSYDARIHAYSRPVWRQQRQHSVTQHVVVLSCTPGARPDTHTHATYNNHYQQQPDPYAAAQGRPRCRWGLRQVFKVPRDKYRPTGQQLQAAQQGDQLPQHPYHQHLHLHSSFTARPRNPTGASLMPSLTTPMVPEAVIATIQNQRASACVKA